jgi:hypothetical protein
MKNDGNIHSMKDNDVTINGNDLHPTPKTDKQKSSLCLYLLILIFVLLAITLSIGISFGRKSPQESGQDNPAIRSPSNPYDDKDNNNNNSDGDYVVNSVSAKPSSSPNDTTSADTDSWINSTSTQTTTTTTTTTRITYFPGNLIVEQNGMILSQGLTSRLIAQKHQRVKYFLRGESNEAFHDFPDGAATFLDPNPNNAGGWIYVSNSEYRLTTQGGVGAVRFNSYGNVIEYKMILKNTRANCGGGQTPWGVRYKLKRRECFFHILVFFLCVPHLNGSLHSPFYICFFFLGCV